MKNKGHSLEYCMVNILEHQDVQANAQGDRQKMKMIFVPSLERKLTQKHF
jgi:hypothetical protein